MLSALGLHEHARLRHQVVHVLTGRPVILVDKAVPKLQVQCRQQSLQAGARLLQIAARCAPASCACQSLKASSFLSKSPTERPRPHWRAKAPKTFSSVYLQRVAFSGRHCPWSKSKLARHVAIPRYSMVVVIGVVMVLALALARCWCWCWRWWWWW